MKKIITYQCEICNREYLSEQAALDCEAKGLPEYYPIGCIYADHEKGAFYANITFAVASNRRMRFSHSNVGSSWACRDIPGVGDSLGNEKCAGNSLRLMKHHGNINPKHPTFKRMVAWLQSEGIDITIWNGEKPIPLEEWLNETKTTKTNRT